MLAKYLEKKYTYSSYSQASGSGSPHVGVCFLELGAGCGLVGLALAAGGFRVIMTDLPPLLPFLRENVVMNNLPDNARVLDLSWGSAPASLAELDRVFDAAESFNCKTNDNDYNSNDNPASCSIDFVVASDCLWVEYLVEPFVATLVEVAKRCEQQQKQQHDGTYNDNETVLTILVAYEERARRTEERFFLLASEHFVITNIPQQDFHAEYRDRVSLLTVCHLIASLHCLLFLKRTDYQVVVVVYYPLWCCNSGTSHSLTFNQH